MPHTLEELLGLTRDKEIFDALPGKDRGRSGKQVCVLKSSMVGDYFTDIHGNEVATDFGYACVGRSGNITVQLIGRLNGKEVPGYVEWTKVEANAKGTVAAALTKSLIIAREVTARSKVAPSPILQGARDMAEKTLDTLRKYSGEGPRERSRPTTMAERSRPVTTQRVVREISADFLHLGARTAGALVSGGLAVSRPTTSKKASVATHTVEGMLFHTFGRLKADLNRSRLAITKWLDRNVEDKKWDAVAKRLVTLASEVKSPAKGILSLDTNAIVNVYAASGMAIDSSALFLGNGRLTLVGKSGDKEFPQEIDSTMAQRLGDEICSTLLLDLTEERRRITSQGAPTPPQASPQVARTII